MSYSPKYRLFLVIVSVLVLANLLVATEWTTILPGAESELLWQAQRLGDFDFRADTRPWLPVVVTSWLTGTLATNEFVVRFPSVLLTLGTFVGFFLMGMKIFGLRSVTAGLVVLGSSLLIVNFGKFATADSWLLFAQTINFLCLLLYLKKPHLKWQIGYWLTILIGAFSQPLSMLVSTLLPWAILLNYHPQGKSLVKLYPLVPWLLFGAAAYSLDLFTVSVPTLVVGYGNIGIGRYVLYHLIGLLPWIGFLFAALVNLRNKLLRKEELSIIMVAWLLGGIFAFSLLPQVVLAFLIGKQLLDFTLPNYPYRSLVKSFSVIQVVFAFCAAVYLMINGFYEYKILGFRAVMTVAIVYWIPAFLAIIGLYGNRRGWILGGLAMSGLLLTLFFWLRINPVLEITRVKADASTKSFPIVANVGYSEQLPGKQLEVYGKAYGTSLQFVSTKEINSFLQKDNSYLIIADSLLLKNEVGIDTTLLQIEIRENSFPVLSRK